MKNTVKFIFLLISMISQGLYLSYAQNPNHENTFTTMEQNKANLDAPAFAGTIQWLGQAAVRIPFQGQIVYIDPYQLKSADKADLILITHDHMDHLSLPDIEKIAGSNTRFVVAKACREKLEKAGYKNIMVISPGTKISISGIGITAVPAYNRVKEMHPKSKEYVGYILDFNGIRVYHTGDTERIPEMKEIRCDIILLPLGQTYTMNSVEEAVEAVLDTKASIAIPIHWGLYEGSEQDARKFGEMMEAKGITVLAGR